MACGECHAIAEKASFPPREKCAGCHKEVGPIPSERVYRLADFVYFSHAKHAAAGCARCHGDVWAMERVTRVLPMTMKACVDCHRSERAGVTCTLCHELNQ